MRYTNWFALAGMSLSLGMTVVHAENAPDKPTAPDLKPIDSAQAQKELEERLKKAADDPANASNEGKGGKGGKKGGPLPNFDTNGDGKLDDAEKAKAKELFEKMFGQNKVFKTHILETFDADKDGKLSDAEKEKAFEEFLADGGGGAKRGMVFEKLDKNGDGKISAEEFASAKGANKNKAAEAGPAPDRKEQFKKLLARFDADGDGQLNEKEFKKAMEDLREMSGQPPPKK